MMWSTPVRSPIRNFHKMRLSEVFRSYLQNPWLGLFLTMLLYKSYFEYLYTFTEIVPYDFQQLREIPSWIKLLNFQVAGGSKCSSHHSRLSLSGQCILLSYPIPTVTKNLISTLIIWCVHIKLRNFFCCPCFRSLLYCNWLDVRGRYGCWQIYVQLY